MNTIPEDFVVVTRSIEDFEALSDGAGRPPRSAKLVARLDYGSGPGGGDYRTYFICSDRHRTCWNLWVRLNDYDTGRPSYAIMAWGEPGKGRSAKEAAWLLVFELLKSEGSTGVSISNSQDGLLDDQDIDEMLEKIADDE